MNWTEAKHIEENKYDLPGDWLKPEYFQALNILFRIENSLRVFVYIVLKNEFKEKWLELSITSDDQETSTIKSISKKRIAQDKNYAYLGYILSSPLLHLTSGELIRIITSDSYWKHFKKYFLGTREIMKTKLDEIGNVRNSLAHFRPIKTGDIELIKQNSIHALSEIEKTLFDFIQCPDTVPTNSVSGWYNELRTLGTEECKLNFRQSKNEEWVKVGLSFSAPILSNRAYDTSAYIKTLNLKTEGVLMQYKELTRHAISVTEELPSLFVAKVEDVRIIKEIRFTFSMQALEKNYEDLKKELENLLIEISKEINLIRDDNLARGNLIEVINIGLMKPEGRTYFSYQGKAFETEIDEDTPVEFFGTLNYSNRNFITNTNKYPWMPVAISEDKGLPF